MVRPTVLDVSTVAWSLREVRATNMANYKDLEIDILLGLAEFQHFDTHYPVENVGPGRVISASFEDTGDDIWVRLVLSSELRRKLRAQGATHHRSAEFLAERTCISTLERATGEINSRVVRGPS